MPQLYPIKLPLDVAGKSLSSPGSCFSLRRGRARIAPDTEPQTDLLAMDLTVRSDILGVGAGGWIVLITERTEICSGGGGMSWPVSSRLGSVLG